MLPSLCSAEYRCKLCLYSVLAATDFKAATYRPRFVQDVNPAHALVAEMLCAHVLGLPSCCAPMAASRLDGQRHPPSPVRQPAPHSPCVLCAVHSTRMHYFCDCDLCCRACVLPSTGANCVCTLSLQTVASRRPRLPLGAPTSTSTSCSVRDKRPVRWTASDYFSSHSHFFFCSH